MADNNILSINVLPKAWDPSNNALIEILLSPSIEIVFLNELYLLFINSFFPIRFS